MSDSNCSFLTCIQISQEAGKVVWYSHLLKNFPHKVFQVVNEAEVDVFLELHCFLREPVSVDSLIFGSSAFSKSSLYVWKFLIHILLRLSLKDLSITLPAGAVSTVVQYFEHSLALSQGYL